MPNVWTQDEVKKLGLPIVPVEAADTLALKSRAWYPGCALPPEGDMLICYHSRHMRLFAELNCPERAVIHFLSFDVGIIEPLWGRKTFLDRCKKLKDYGFNRIISPDFSAWANFAIPLQIYNIYRSAVVTSDFANNGFKIVANVQWSLPELKKHIYRALCAMAKAGIS